MISIHKIYGAHSSLIFVICGYLIIWLLMQWNKSNRDRHSFHVNNTNRWTMGDLTIKKACVAHGWPSHPLKSWPCSVRPVITSRCCSSSSCWSSFHLGLMWLIHGQLFHHWSSINLITVYFTCLIVMTTRHQVNHFKFRGEFKKKKIFWLNFKKVSILGIQFHSTNHFKTNKMVIIIIIN